MKTLYVFYGAFLFEQSVDSISILAVNLFLKRMTLLSFLEILHRLNFYLFQTLNFNRWKAFDSILIALSDSSPFIAYTAMLIILVVCVRMKDESYRRKTFYLLITFG